MSSTDYSFTVIDGSNFMCNVHSCSVEGDIKLLTNFKDGQMTIGSRDRSNQKWVVTYEKDNATSESYLYDRESKTLSLLFLHHPKLKEYELGNTYPHTVKSRDDLDILVYLTLPPGLKAQNLPMVLRIHGGPWYRDWWGCDSENQFWATRGYGQYFVSF
jgi:dipeptidyl aminopeptidase/acylaminoacyl peptidase